MPEITDTGFLSIGEVLGLLLEEFPDITISKIRFLESQGHVVNRVDFIHRGAGPYARAAAVGFYKAARPKLR